MKFNNWRIRDKIIASILVAALMFLIMGIVAIVSTGKVYKNGDYIATNSLPSIQAAQSIDTATGDYTVSLYRHIIAEQKDQMAAEEKVMADINKKIQDLITKYNKELVSNEKDQANINAVKQNWDDFMKINDKIIALSQNLKTQDAMKLMNEQGNPKLDDVNKAINQLIDLNQGLVQDNYKSLVSTYDATKIGSIIFLCIGIILLIGINTIILISITRPLAENSNKLEEAAKMIASASGQLSASSQQLAEASAEQAASIEEVSATMEESASMVYQSTENTKQASTLATQANEASNRGSMEMKQMMVSMEDIKKSSGEIANIIKVIDDIAFQTNILALNAAVEAARAGDVGKGFAVVAEEVRNLAQRSANAANDTASIIQRNIELSVQGVDAASTVNEVLNEVSVKIEKLNNIVSEVAAASQEQSQGIEQVNKAIMQMETVTQQNAAGAEESAAAAEEMNAQAVELQEITELLGNMVNGKDTVNKSNYKTSVKSHNRKQTSIPIANKMKPSNIYSKDKNTVTKKTNSLSPKDVIPLEDDDEF